jgi:hypothetical protein
MGTEILAKSGMTPIDANATNPPADSATTAITA